MKKILVGTHNKGKFKEIATLISKKYKKFSPKTFKIPSPEETGKNFISNSRLKANFFSKYVNMPVISDDSGLCIRSLNNMPGIYSARLAKKNRKAYFVCSLSYKNSNKKTITVTGKIYGTIAHNILGKNGFGYDPIFIPRSYIKTFGELPKSKKLKIDHRYIAFRKLKKKVKIL